MVTSNRMRGCMHHTYCSPAPDTAPHVDTSLLASRKRYEETVFGRPASCLLNWCSLLISYFYHSPVLFCINFCFFNFRFLFRLSPLSLSQNTVSEYKHLIPTSSILYWNQLSQVEFSLQSYLWARISHRICHRLLSFALNYSKSIARPAVPHSAKKKCTSVLGSPLPLKPKTVSTVKVQLNRTYSAPS